MKEAGAILSLSKKKSRQAARPTQNEGGGRRQNHPVRLADCGSKPIAAQPPRLTAVARVHCA